MAATLTIDGEEYDIDLDALPDNDEIMRHGR
jgi:hypothetical protein